MPMNEIPDDAPLRSRKHASFEIPAMICEPTSCIGLAIDAPLASFCCTTLATPRKGKSF